MAAARESVEHRCGMKGIIGLPHEGVEFIRVRKDRIADQHNVITVTAWNSVGFYLTY
jgi:hypothetical protein